MKVVPATVGPVKVSGVPSLDSCASTISTERSDSTTDGPNSTAQVRLTSDPTGQMGFGLLLVRFTEIEVGTRGVYMCLYMYTLIALLSMSLFILCKVISS